MPLGHARATEPLGGGGTGSARGAMRFLSTAVGAPAPGVTAGVLPGQGGGGGVRATGDLTAP